MINMPHIHHVMKKMLDEYGFETMKRPDPFFHPDVPGIHDEHTFFLPTNEQTKKKWPDSFLVLTFEYLMMYQRKDFSDRLIEKIRYISKEELIELLYRHAPLREGWQDALFEQVKVYLRENYQSFIIKEHENRVDLTLPYNRTASKDQRIVVYPAAVALEIFTGTTYAGVHETQRTKDYRNRTEFLDAMKYFYEPANIWTENNNI